MHNVTEEAPPRRRKREICAYSYTDENGHVLYQVVRYEPKAFKQCRLIDGQRVWKLDGVRHVPYRLPELLSSPPFVCIVEGEKDVETLRSVQVTATCNAMGAGKWRAEYAEYFKDQAVFIIPDRDEPGQEHGQQVAESLNATAKAVRLVELPSEHNGKPIKDVTDLRESCSSDDEFRGVFEDLRQAAIPFAPASAEPAEEKQEDATSEAYDSLPRSCYRVYLEVWEHGGKKYPPGTWYHKRTVTKKGEVIDTGHRICAPLEVLAKTSARGDMEHGRLVAFVSSNGNLKRHVLPMRLFAGRGDEALAELMSLGLETSRAFHSHVLDYIQGSAPRERYATALSTGWHNEDAFVLPDEVICPEGHHERIWYQGRDQESPYGRAGTLADWQAKVATLAPGNPNLVAAICAAFAGPLLFKFGVHGALVHLFGPSSTGKTTILSAAASPWGGGTVDGKNVFVRTWQSTAVGIEATASLHSDTLAVLDELHLVEARVLDPVTYAFANGCGKSRGNVHAGIRPTKRWRVFGLSSGEMSCDTWLRAGGMTVRAGQTVRMLDVPVQGDHGAFDNLHGLSSGKAFADALARNVNRHYGHAGPAFVRALIDENPNLDPLLDETMGNFAGENAIQSRAARVFAIMAVAGELAIRYEIVPWEKTEALTSCVTLFNRWKEQMLASNAESPDSKILKMIATYISRFAESRFSDIAGSNPDEPRINDRSGYWKQVVGGQRIYLFRSDTLLDAAKGYDIRQIGKALETAGALSETGDEDLAAKAQTPNGTRERFYHIDPDKLEKM